MNPLLPYLDPLPLIAVLRGITPEEIPAISGALVAEGFRVLEVPLNSPRPFDSIRLLANACGDRCLVGAGTVLNIADVARVRVKCNERPLRRILHPPSRVLRLPRDRRGLPQHGAICRTLRGKVEGGVDGDIALLQRVRANRVDQGAHGVERERLVSGVRAPFILGDAHWLAGVVGRLGGRDVAVLRHQGEHEVAAAETPLRMVTRRICTGPLG